VRLDGAAITLRVDAAGGRVDDDMKKLAKRFNPKDKAKKAERQAARAKAGGGDAE
jgi:hypothetical protein